MRTKNAKNASSKSQDTENKTRGCNGKAADNTKNKTENKGSRSAKSCK